MRSGKPALALYLECFSGISGDMMLGALLDAGAPLKALKEGLAGLGLEGWTISRQRVARGGLNALKANVKVLERSQPARRLSDIRKLIKGSSLSPRVKQNSLNVFERIFEAEARVHGTKAHLTHLHELGAADAVIDIVGTSICLELLGISSITHSAVNLGGGSVKTSHGVLPVPAPATLDLLKGSEVYGTAGAGELATPTGAAILATLSHGCGPMPRMTPIRTGTGAGGRETHGSPNVLRATIGIVQPQTAEALEVAVIEANIDDMTPEMMGHAMARIMESGALDVFVSHGLMKKGRPGFMLSALSTPETTEAVARAVMSETTTFGLRISHARRMVLERSTRTVKTPYGKIRIKDGLIDGNVLKSSPEYDDCSQAARRHGVSIIEVFKAATLAMNKDRG